MICKHNVTQGRDGEKGSWCCACGLKILDVETRVCGDCAHHQAVFRGSRCAHHHMRVSPDMHVTFKLEQGSCFTSIDIAQEQAKEVGQ